MNFKKLINNINEGDMKFQALAMAKELHTQLGALTFIDMLAVMNPDNPAKKEVQELETKINELTTEVGAFIQKYIPDVADADVGDLEDEPPEDDDEEEKPKKVKKAVEKPKADKPMKREDPPEEEPVKETTETTEKTSFTNFLNEGEVISSKVTDTKYDWIYKFKDDPNYDHTLIQKHKNYDDLIDNSRFSHPPSDKEYIAIKVVGTSFNAVKKELQKQVNKNKGYELLHSYVYGKKGQDWTSQVWKHGFGGEAVMFK